MRENFSEPAEALLHQAVLPCYKIVVERILIRNGIGVQQEGKGECDPWKILQQRIRFFNSFRFGLRLAFRVFHEVETREGEASEKNENVSGKTGSGAFPAIKKAIPEDGFFVSVQFF
jgi:hypothetical protein